MDKTVILKAGDSLIYLKLIDNKAVSIDIENPGIKTGDVYTGKVCEYVKNIDAYFVDISNGNKVFLRSKTALKIGDKILVQIKKEQSNNKKYEADSEIEISGTFAVIKNGNGDIGISQKIMDDEFRNKIKESLLDKYPEIDIIIRTKALEKSIEDVLNEVDILANTYNDIIEKYQYQKVGSLLYSKEEYLNKYLGDSLVETDDENVFNKLKELSDKGRIDKDNIKLYEDDYPLYNLYDVNALIKHILSEKVYLKSGGNIIIEGTSALTSVDVNTGKNTKGKDRNKLYFDINLEAAYEILRQVTLRSLSGIIIIDFINMTDKELCDKLSLEIKNLIKKEYSDISFAGFTKLGLCEITRKKTNLSLKERWEKIIWMNL